MINAILKSIAYVLLRCKYIAYDSMQWCSDVCIYYVKNKEFAKTDILLRSNYFFENYYHTAGIFRYNLPLHLTQCYGETPNVVLEQMVSNAGLNKNMSIAELGCGRGRVSFWLHHHIQCHVVGIDIVPSFVMRARQVCKQRQLQYIEFEQTLIQDFDFNSIDAIYFYGAAFPDEVIECILKKIISLQKDITIISLGVSLYENYVNHSPLVSLNCSPKYTFHQLKKIPVKLVWGNSYAYIERWSSFME